MKAKKVTGGSTAIRILKIATCTSLSGKSTLTYHVGCQGVTDVRFRVYDNDGGGFYSKEWVAASDIQKALSKHPLVTSASLHPLFHGKSANSGGFLLAVLKHEGLFARSVDSPRCYLATESQAFVAELQALIEAGVDLDPDAPPTKPGKPGKKSPPVKAATVATAKPARRKT